MRRREFVALLGAVVGVPSLPASAQETGRVPVVAFVSAASPNPSLMATFEQGLREQSRAPGTTIRIEARYAEGDLQSGCGTRSRNFWGRA
jgi:hypothetical protein